MQAVYEAIFSFSEGYNFVYRQVCSEFREIAPKVEPLLYLDSLCKDGRVPQKVKSSSVLAHGALNFGYTNILAWCDKEHIPGNICDLAAEKGYLEVLEWARTKGYSWSVKTCVCAASAGHLEILKWLRANGCPWDEDTCSYAACKGHLEILKWARSNACPWDCGTCAYAALGGHLDILKWARANGCPWYFTDTCSLAALGGHLDILKWARSNGFPWDRGTILNASRRADPEVLNWARANGCPER
jgi:hypothetical protein